MIKYSSHFEIIDNNKLHVEITNLKTNHIQKETIEITNPQLLADVYNTISFQLEELEYGLYGDKVDLHRFVTTIITHKRNSDKNRYK